MAARDKVDKKARSSITASEDDILRCSITASPTADFSRRASVQDTATDATMRKTWEGGKFMIHAEVPRGKEEPRHVRDLALLPRSKEPAADVLKRHGTAVMNVKGKKKQNDQTVGQDMFSCTHLGLGWWLDLVADGHGVIGDKVADRVCQTLPHFLSSSECSSLLAENKVQEAYQVAFERTQKDIEDVFIGDMKIQFSGTTCVCVLRQEGNSSVYVAWVGDSKAIMIKPDGTLLKRTQEHKPENTVERERILNMGCEIVNCEHDDGIILQKINVKGESYPSISFTRSFGDQIVKDLGVFAKPEVEVWETTKTAGGKGFFGTVGAAGGNSGQDAPGYYLLLASDGIWEFMEEAEVAKILGDAMKRGQTPEVFLPELVAKAQETWATNEGDYLDDITAVFLPSKAPSPKPPEPEPDGCNCFAMCSMM